MPTHKSEDYKLSAVEYYLTEDNSQEEVCKIFKCSARSLMRWVDKYNEEGMHEKKPLTSYEYSSSIVDGIIDSWANSKEYVDNFPVTFSAVKYSNPVTAAIIIFP